MTTTTDAYAAIRRTEGREWIDLTTLSGLLPTTQSVAESGDCGCGPHWEKDNPVIRYAHVTILETPER